MSTHEAGNSAPIGCGLTAHWRLSADGKQLLAGVAGAGAEGTLSAARRSLEFKCEGVTSAAGALSVELYPDGRLKSLSARTFGREDWVPCSFDGVIAEFPFKGRKPIGCGLDASWALSLDGRQIAVGAAGTEGTLSAAKRAMDFKLQMGTDNISGTLSIELHPDGRVRNLSGKTFGTQDWVPCGGGGILAEFP
jgi:hypothetical protein